MSEANKPGVDPFSLAAGVPVAPVEGELAPKPKTSIGMSRKIVGVIIALGVVFLALFLAALDRMDQPKPANSESAKKEDEKPNEDIAGQLPKDFQSTKVGAVNKPAEALPTDPAPSEGEARPANGQGNTVPAPGGVPANGTAVVPAVPSNAPGAMRVPPANGQGNGANQLSPEELRAQKVKEERESRLLQARLVGLEVKGYQEANNNGGSSSGAVAAATRAEATRQRSDAMINSMLSNLSTKTGGSSAPSAGGIPGSGASAAGGDQDEKLRFINNASTGSSGVATNGYLEHTVMPPLSSSQLNAGAFIPSILETGVNSDLPGQVTARVRENVFASVNENCLLLPSGSQLVGTYNSKIALGQARQLVVWNRVFFPNGHELNLAGMSSADLGGQAGLEADVDNHYLRLFGMTLGMSLVTAAVQISVGTPATSASGVTATPSAAQSVSTALSQQFGQLGGQLFGKYLNIQPTLRNYPGERFNIVVPRSIVFPKCYGR